MSLEKSNLQNQEIVIFQPPEEVAEQFVPAIQKAVMSADGIKFAYFFVMAIGNGEPSPVIGIYFDDSFRKEARTEFITSNLDPQVRSSISSGIAYDIVVLNDLDEVLGAVLTLGAEAHCLDYNLRDRLVEQERHAAPAEQRGLFRRLLSWLLERFGKGGG